MSLEILPDEILEQVFKNFDNDTLWSALKYSERWFSIIVTSKLLMSLLKVEVTDKNISEIKAMNLPIKNLTFKGFKVNDGNLSFFKKFAVLFEIVDSSCSLYNFTRFISNPSNSLENVKFDGMTLPALNSIFDVLSNVKTLKSISIDNCHFRHETIVEKLPDGSFLNLKEISLKLFRDPLIFEYLNKIKTLEKVEFVCHNYDNGISRKCLPALLEKVPSIKHLSLDGGTTAVFFASSSFPFKLERLDTCYFGSNYSHYEGDPRLDFLKCQLGSLKHLRLLKLPYDYDGGELMRFIVEEMELDSLYYRDTPLIVNGMKNEDVKDFIWINEVQVKAGLEIVRQFPGIKKLEIGLCATPINQLQARQFLNPQTNVFLGIEELKVEDWSGNCDLVSCFSGLYKNCRNVKKFVINSTTKDLNEILRDVLPQMTQLKELHLTVKINERIKEIIQKNIQVESLSVYFNEEVCEILKENKS